MENWPKIEQQKSHLKFKIFFLEFPFFNYYYFLDYFFFFFFSECIRTVCFQHTFSANKFFYVHFGNFI